MEWDDLKRRWKDLDATLDRGIRLNTHLLRQSHLVKVESAMTRLSRLIVLGLALDAGMIVCLGAFIARHVESARFVIPAAGLLLFVVALATAGVRQVVAIHAIYYGAPIVTIQKRLESLRVERIRELKLVLLLSPLLWTPLLIVALEGLLGVDAYAALDTTWLVANWLFGLLVIPLALWIARRHADRMTRSPLARNLLRTLAGHNLAAATAFLSSLEQFEAEDATR